MFLRALVFATFAFPLSFANATVNHLECEDIPEVYNHFSKWHVAKKDPELSKQISTVEAFFRGIEKEFLRQLDPASVIFLDTDVQDVSNKNPERTQKQVMEEKNCDRFEAIVSLFKDIRKLRTEILVRFMGRPALFEQIVESAKKYEKISKGHIAKIRAEAKPAKDIAELETRWIDYLALEYAQSKKALKDLSDDLEVDSYLVATNSLMRFYMVDEELTVAEIMMKAALKGADPHSAYMDFQTFKDFEDQRKSGFVGLGIAYVDGGRGFYVREVLKGGSAEKAQALRKRDLILSINGRSTIMMTLKDFYQSSSGPKDTEVVLEILREGKMQTISLKRMAVNRLKENLITDLLEVDGKKIGYIKLINFMYADTAKDMKKRMEDMEKQDVIDGWVLDLRDNPGGMLGMAVDVAGLFLGPAETVVHIVDTTLRESFVPLRTNRFIGHAFNQPLVVLTSRRSASAAEITAEALQLHGRALVISDSATTFRKGTIQQPQRFSVMKNNDQVLKGALKLTLGYFYNVLGEPFQNRGVSADVVLPVKSDVDDSFDETDLAGALNTPSALPILTELADTYKRAREPMRKFAQNIASKYGEKFVESFSDKDIVLEAGSRLVVDQINDEEISKIHAKRKSDVENPMGTIFPDLTKLKAD